MRTIVIGAGPAGSLAAILLARRGAGVTLVEQHAFPRDKVCGECLSALGRSVLQRHNLTIDGIDLRRTHLIAPGHETTLHLPTPMLGITRARLDTRLLDAARAAGATIRQPARVEAIDGTTVRVRDLRSNAINHLPADYVIVADGRGALFGERPALTGELGIKAHFAHARLDPAAITLFGGGGCYGGVAPVEGGLCNVAFAVPSTRVKDADGDLDRAFDQVRRDLPALDAALRGAERVGEWLASPLPRYGVRRDWPERVIPVGNAACAIEPVGGEGMGVALRSAELAADAVLGDRVASLPRAYRRLWRGRSILCRLGGAALASERWAGPSVALAGCDGLARIGLALVGK